MNDELQDFGKLESEIKKLYTKKLNSLISSYEIYNHDLHPNILEGIVIIFQTFTISKKENDNYEALSAAYSQSIIVMRDLYLALIDTYENRIMVHKKFNKRFNQNGVPLNESNICFKQYTDQQHKKIKKLRKKVCSKYRIDSKQNESLINIKDVSELRDVFKEYHSLLEKYETHAEKIIGSGYNGTFASKLYRNVCLSLTTGIAIISLILFFIRIN